jgi:hypothetical protein
MIFGLHSKENVDELIAAEIQALPRTLVLSYYTMAYGDSNIALYLKHQVSEGVEYEMLELEPISVPYSECPCE